MGYQILNGDCLSVLKTLPSESVQTCITSPPYWGLRDYGTDGQIGLERSPQDFVGRLVDVFEEVKRILKPDATCWINLGDSFFSSQNSNRNGLGGTIGGDVRGGGEYKTQKRNAGEWGLKPKDLCGIPWRVAFALQDAGWWLRQDIIWSKPNPMPESVTDRCTKAHEYIFLLTKSPRYYYDNEAIKEPVKPENVERTLREREKHGVTSHKRSMYEAGVLGDRSMESLAASVLFKNYAARGTEGRNKRSVWTVTTQPYSEAHFATFPPKLIEPMVLAGSREGDTVLDPFNGSGTTGLVALRHRRRYIGIELNPEYIKISEKRLRDVQVNLFS